MRSGPQLANVRQAIDLKGNHVRESLRNGCSRIVPVDPSELFKAKHYPQTSPSTPGRERPGDSAVRPPPPAGAPPPAPPASPADSASPEPGWVFETSRRAFHAMNAATEEAVSSPRTDFLTCCFSVSSLGTSGIRGLRIAMSSLFLR